MKDKIPSEINNLISQARPVKEPEEPPKEPPKSSFKPFRYVILGALAVLLAVSIVPDKKPSENGAETPQPILIQEPAKVQINIAADPHVTTHIEFVPDTGNEIIEIKPENDQPTVVLTPPKPETPRIILSEPKKPAPIKIKITQTRKEPEKKAEEAAPKPPPEVTYGFSFVGIGCSKRIAPNPYLNQ